MNEKFHRIMFEFNLHEEDYNLVAGIIKEKLEEYTGEEKSIADVLQACLTYGIHKAYENATGKEFVLRMERVKPKA